MSLERRSRHRSTMSPSLARVATVIPRVRLWCSTAPSIELAEQCDTSIASVVRFCQAVGLTVLPAAHGASRRSSARSLCSSAASWPTGRTFRQRTRSAEVTAKISALEVLAMETVGSSTTTSSRRWSTRSTALIGSCCSVSVPVSSSQKPSSQALPDRSQRLCLLRAPTRRARPPRFSSRTVSGRPSPTSVRASEVLSSLRLAPTVQFIRLSSPAARTSSMSEDSPITSSSPKSADERSGPVPWSARSPNWCWSTASMRVSLSAGTTRPSRRCGAPARSRGASAVPDVRRQTATTPGAPPSPASRDSSPTATGEVPTDFAARLSPRRHCADRPVVQATRKECEYLVTALTLRRFAAGDGRAIVTAWMEAAPQDGMTERRLRDLVLLDRNFDADGLIVAVAGERVVGAAYAVRRLVAHHGDDLQPGTGWIPFFFVVPSARRKGLGRELRDDRDALVARARRARGDLLRVHPQLRAARPGCGALPGGRRSARLPGLLQRSSDQVPWTAPSSATPCRRTCGGTPRSCGRTAGTSAPRRTMIWCR